MLRLGAPLFVLAAVVGCGDDARSLIVELKTDLVPGQEFAAVVTEVLRDDVPVTQDEVAALLSDDYFGGNRIGEFEVEADATYLVRVQLVTVTGTPAITRDARVSVGQENVAVTVLITRDCVGVSCPGPSDAPDATACFGGQCGSPACLLESAEACEADECAADTDCASAIACVEGRCVAGACFEEALVARCGAGEWCDPNMGCRENTIFDAGPDASDSGVMTDSSVDSAMPADTAAPPDTEPDAVVDSGGTGGCSRFDVNTIALYDFEGSSLDDASGRHDGTIAGGAPLWVTGPGACGQAFGFPASGTITGRIPDSPEWDIGLAGSIDFWFRAPGDGLHHGLVSRDASGSAQPGHFNSWIDVDGRVVVRLQGSGGEGVRCSVGAVAPDVWHHVGANFGTLGFELWIDRVEQDGSGSTRIVEPVGPEFSLPCAQNTMSTISGNANVWVIGANNGYSSEGTTNMIVSPLNDGAIDHLRISNRRRDFSSARP